MKLHRLPQGSPEWHAHRAQHFNASDAPAMLGCSPYMTRTQLLHAVHTGIRPEADPNAQRRFDRGHEIEASRRPMAEAIIGEALYPLVGTDGELSASFDGLTMLRDTNWECKSLNDELRAALPHTDDPERNDASQLPKCYRVQMEQQCMVAGCERVLFTASDGQADDRHCWYTPDPALRAEIIAGWKQFAEDLAAYKPPAAAVMVVAAPVEALPAVSVQVSGSIMVHENFGAFETAVRDFLEHRLIREPKTDQDFADLDVQIKAMKGAEAALESAEQQMLAQIQTVDAAKRTKDMLHKLVRENRLMAEKLLTNEKERRRGEIVAGGMTALREHIAGLNERLGKPYMPQVPADFGGVIRGKKSLTSMEDAVAVELARAKIAASEIADRIQVNLNWLREHAKDHTALFPDTGAIVMKAHEDLVALAQNRINEHKQAEAARLEAQREQIRKEEAEKFQREQEARDREAARQAEAAAKPAPALAAAPAAAPASISQAPAANSPTVVPIRPAVESTATIRLGQIGERLGFTLTADFVASLGFEPVATDKSAKLYREADFDLILEALIAHVRTVQAKQLQAA